MNKKWFECLKIKTKFSTINQVDNKRTKTTRIIKIDNLKNTTLLLELQRSFSQVLHKAPDDDFMFPQKSEKAHPRLKYCEDSIKFKVMT